MKTRLPIILLCLVLLAGARSGKWPAFRDQVISEHPYCDVCGVETNELYGLTLHHKKLFSEDPTMELVRSNVVVVCYSIHQPKIGDHWKVGHLGISYSVGATNLDEVLKGEPGKQIWMQRNNRKKKK